MSEKWETRISSSGEDSVVRGVAREDVMEMDFGDAIWLILKGEKPSEAESEMFNVILSSSIDHGIGNPSTVAARTIQSGGNEMNTSVAGGILALGDKHGGAIEDCMYMLQSDEEPEEIVEQRLSDGEVVPGLGHKVYDNGDPRAEEILDRASDLNIAGGYVDKMASIRNELSERKVKLPINVDGAISAVMSDLGWPPSLGKGFFIISRTPGLVAHVDEEMSFEDDFRREDGDYVGDE